LIEETTIVSNLNSPTAIATKRRIIFALSLLLTGLLVRWANQNAHRILGFPIGFAFLGFLRPELTLAIWISCRAKSWSTRSTWIKLAVYSIALLMGGILEDLYFHWLLNATYFRTLYLLCDTLLFSAVLSVGKLALVDRDSGESVKTLSMWSMLLWITLFAITLCVIKSVNSDFAPDTPFAKRAIRST
jgi:hypothetical protein